MLRTLIYGLTILHLGPGFAFAVVALGCDSDMSMFASVCQQDTFSTFIQLTLWAWCVMTLLLLCKLAVEKKREHM